MIDSSDSKTSAFSGLTLRQAFLLIETIQESKLRTEEQVKAVFSRSSPGFDATLSFLVELGVVKKDEDKLILVVDSSITDIRSRQTWLLSRLVNKPSSFRSEMFSYLRKYKVDNGELIYRAPTEGRSHESGVRNFLMEMEIVQLIRENREYIIPSDYVSIYARAKGIGRPVSPELLTKSLAVKSELGLAAEMAVVAYEKNRLGPALTNEVDHIALRNTAVGYDIQSLTVKDDGSRSPRYIEVKAVSRGSMGFFWTQNEMNVAQIFQDLYYLYLLPITVGGGFDSDHLRIIPNPYSMVLGQQSEWVTELGVIRCSLKKEHGNRI